MTKCFIYHKTDKDGKHIFRTSENEPIVISSFENGIATLEPEYMSHILTVGKIVEDLFKEDSCFIYELLASYECKEEDAFKGIKFEFNGAEVLVTKQDANKEKIHALYLKALEAKYKKDKLEYEAYMKTPKYRKLMANRLKKECRERVVREEVFSAIENMDIEFKNSDEKERWKEFTKAFSTNYYELNIVAFANKWVRCMQYLMNKHNLSVSKIAQNSIKIADTGGITGHQYATAVSVISGCWAHGEELCLWHNKRYGYEDTDVIVCPSIIKV